MPQFYSTREVADLFGVRTWQVRRLFESGELPEPVLLDYKRCLRTRDLSGRVPLLSRNARLASTFLVSLLAVLHTPKARALARNPPPSLEPKAARLCPAAWCTNRVLVRPGSVLSSSRRRASRVDCRRVPASLQAASSDAATATRRFARAAALRPGA